ncbi:NAD(P)-binding protein [Zopfia rhizophila CBS 207.26]|uniref:NAD(P)-binding protein n=1 Tax=Zopfia rhizophila CBS 207.26 TaxID=1314779 RepID=A0A6A6E5D7_9PEZI|nr:NAD(P)-binding protein [Zopfia rhizophila CBS 207.26]
MAVGDLSLQGKIVVVTGGGSGMHLAFSKLAHAEGAKVIIADLRLGPESENLSPEIVFQSTDVRKWSDLRNLVEVSKEKFGDVPDVYVAGAGVFEPDWSNFWDDTEDQRYAAVDINVNHPIKLTRIAIRALREKNKKGVVLIMSSIAGYSRLFGAPMYATTKHALVGFARSMKELDELVGIKVVAMCPGIVNTPLWKSRSDAETRWGYKDDIAISAEDVAKAEIKLIKEGEYGGGTIYEISLFGERVVLEWNIDPPGHDRLGEMRGAEIPKEAMEAAYKPIMDALNSR